MRVIVMSGSGGGGVAGAGCGGGLDAGGIDDGVIEDGEAFSAGPASPDGLSALPDGAVSGGTASRDRRGTANPYDSSKREQRIILHRRRGV
jgi:hypothetical protein